MQRFILRENIDRFERLLSFESDEVVRRTLRALLTEAQRKLAETEARMSGVERWSVTALRAEGLLGRMQPIISKFQQDFEISGRPYLVLDPRPGLYIVDINDAYAEASMAARRKVAGERLFDVFPDNPDDPSADGVNNLYNSLKTAAETGKPHTMAVQRYDVRDKCGRFVERYWRPLNTPLLNEEGRLIFLLHHVEDVTEAVLNKRLDRSKD
jgi:PAS domain-containing protein